MSDVSSTVYLSVVIVARGSEGAQEVQATLDASQGLTIASERIVVLSGEGSGSADALLQAHGSVRVLRCPGALTAGAALNAGIRHARGQFVLATNAGVYPSAGVVQQLNDASLRDGVLYRANVLEVGEHGCCAWFREGCMRVTHDGMRLTEAEDICPADGSIALGDGWFPLEPGERCRWVESTAAFGIVRPGWALPELVCDLETGPSAGGPLVVQIVDEQGAALMSTTLDGRCRASLRVPEELRHARLTLRVEGGRLPLEHDLRLLNLCVRRLRWRTPWEVADVASRQPPRDWDAAVADAAKLMPVEYLHANAADDFLLMARANWDALRGYPELAIPSEFSDLLFCYSAHYAGIREQVLEAPVYRRAGTRTPAAPGAAIDFARVAGWITQMRRLRAPMILNRGNWGCGVKP